jgi:hypothetical protein
VRPASPAYAQLEPAVLLLMTYGFVLVLMTIGAALLRRSIVKFVVGFTVVFWLSYLCWVLGNYAYIAVTTPAEMQRLGMAWSLRLTGEFGYVAALLVGLAIANLTPALANWLNEAARAELYIKTAIVILGGTVGVKAAEQLGLASSVMWRGLAAIIEAYLIYWAVVYFVARKWFGFSREWAAPLASGISICGVSAAIATAGAIRARPDGRRDGVFPRRGVRHGRAAGVAVRGAHVPGRPAARRRRMDGIGREDRRRRGRQRRDHGGAHLCRRSCPGHQVRQGLDRRHDHDDQDLHRHLHRHLGVHPGLYLGASHRAAPPRR